MSVWSSRALSVLRIVAALLFIEHGTMKLLHFPIARPGLPSPLPPLLLAASTIEIGCGLLLAIGLFIRIAGLLASGEMAVAYCIGHLPNSFWPGVNGGGEVILYCFLFLYLALEGGSRWSIDVIRDRC
jgi:putative oxidoreductase